MWQYHFILNFFYYHYNTSESSYASLDSIVYLIHASALICYAQDFLVASEFHGHDFPLYVCCD